jgi:general secretion pathway protein G
MISTLKKLQAKKAAQENNGGFTLIELLIVIVVLGILAAVVVFSLGSVTGQSAIAACQADGATVETAISAYNAQNTSGTPSAANLVSGGYLVSFPANTTHYLYVIDTTGVLWEAKTGATIPAVTSPATSPTPTQVAAATTATPSLPWTKWAGASTCNSTSVG